MSDGISGWSSSGFESDEGLSGAEFAITSTPLA